MRPWVLPRVILIYGAVVLPSLLGDIRPRSLVPGARRETDQCWVQPPSEYCGRRCTKLQECLHPNHTCCWTFCGNICLDKDEPFKTLLKPQL